MALASVLCPDLIGREVELSILEDALLATLRGDGRVVILGGEAVMGKTRLVNRRVRAWLEEQRIAPERLELGLKGFDAPLAAYRLVARAATPSGG
jgi:AAA ATPase domain